MGAAAAVPGQMAPSSMDGSFSLVIGLVVAVPLVVTAALLLVVVVLLLLVALLLLIAVLLLLLLLPLLLRLAVRVRIPVRGVATVAVAPVVPAMRPGVCHIAKDLAMRAAVLLLTRAVRVVVRPAVVPAVGVVVSPLVVRAVAGRLARVLLPAVRVSAVGVVAAGRVAVVAMRGRVRVRALLLQPGVVLELPGQQEVVHRILNLGLVPGLADHAHGAAALVDEDLRF